MLNELWTGRLPVLLHGMIETARNMSLHSANPISLMNVCFCACQVEAIDTVTAGRHVVVCTSTASGKSLCYNLPILATLAANPNSCAIYMFPTKALAQDQLQILRHLSQLTFWCLSPPCGCLRWRHSSGAYFKLKLRSVTSVAQTFFLLIRASEILHPVMTLSASARALHTRCLVCLMTCVLKPTSSIPLPTAIQDDPRCRCSFLSCIIHCICR